MTVMVRFWNNYLLTGHVSVETDKDYVSFHPPWLLAAPMPVGRKFSSLEEDVRNLTLVEEVEIAGSRVFDDQACATASIFVKALSPNYDIRAWNCSVIAARILFSGWRGHEEQFSQWFDQSGIQHKRDWDAVLSEYRRGEIVQAASDLIPLDARSAAVLIARGHPALRVAAAMFGAASLLSKSAAWTPANVRDLVTAIEAESL